MMVMTDSDLRAAIKASAPLRALIDAGADSDVADALNAAAMLPVPVTVASLTAAAPQTLAAIAAGANPLSEIEVIAARVRAGDAEGIARWADLLTALGKMPPAEHAAVLALAAGAAPVALITADQVSRAFAGLRGGKVAPLNWEAV